MSDITLWCILEGDDSDKPFPITTTSVKSIGYLKTLIYPEINTNPDVNAKDLVLWKVRYF
jgi:hypothetical protein